MSLIADKRDCVIVTRVRRPERDALVRLAQSNDRSPSRELARALAFYIAHERMASEYFKAQIDEPADG
jgi:hypothetical protein